MADQIISKRCPKCKQIKLLSEFCKDKRRADGRGTYCKLCQNAIGRRYYHTPQGKQKKCEYENSATGKQVRYRAIKRWRNSDKGKQTINRIYRNHFYQFRAKRAVQYAIETGRLPKLGSLKCDSCTRRAEHYHHYLGYNRKHWLDVIPLCRKCHRETHNLSHLKILDGQRKEIDRPTNRRCLEP